MTAEDNLNLEPAGSGPAGDPVVTDVDGRLWRVRRRPSGTVLDVLLAVLALALAAAIAAAALL